MTDLISRLAEIRELQGRDPLPDPSKIQGFDPQALPPEKDYPIRPPVDLSQVPEGPDFDDEMDLDESPLIPRAEISGNFPLAGPPSMEEIAAWKPALPKPEWAAVGTENGFVASHRDRQLELNERECQAIKRIIVQAERRVLRAQIAELASVVGKRKRKVRGQRGTAPEETPQPALPQSVAPKRRGRPPKQRLDGGTR